MKRAFDLIWSVIGLILFSPLFLLIAFLIKCNSKGPVFYKQTRVGKNDKDFKIYKFRSMFIDSDKKGLLTVGDKDNRVTNIGFYLRKYKIDELPQLINVFLGEMSFVGPRPEVRKYVNLYSEQQKKVLFVKPGITDLASVVYRNENEILSKQENPEKYYIKVIMKEKIEINLNYIANRNFFKDIWVIFRTFKVL